jgi:hypothetical protein
LLSLSGSPLFLWLEKLACQFIGTASCTSTSSERRESRSSAMAPFCGIRAGKSVFPGLYISVATLYKSHAVICPLLMASFSTSSVKMEIWLWFNG